jgi:hypothetical protein
MAPSRPTSRGFLPWRLSDDGPGASRVVAMGRHPKPFTMNELYGENGDADIFLEMAQLLNNAGER